MLLVRFGTYDGQMLLLLVGFGSQIDKVMVGSQELLQNLRQWIYCWSGIFRVKNFCCWIQAAGGTLLKLFLDSINWFGSIIEFFPDMVSSQFFPNLESLVSSSQTGSD